MSIWQSIDIIKHVCSAPAAIEHSIVHTIVRMNYQWRVILYRNYSYDCLDYRKTYDIRRTLVGNKIVDHSDVVGASPVGAAPTTSSCST